MAVWLRRARLRLLRPRERLKKKQAGGRLALLNILLLFSHSPAWSMPLSTPTFGGNRKKLANPLTLKKPRESSGFPLTGCLS